jgi:hypothetical protein
VSDEPKRIPLDRAIALAATPEALAERLRVVEEAVVEMSHTLVAFDVWGGDLWRKLRESFPTLDLPYPSVLHLHCRPAEQIVRLHADLRRLADEIEASNQTRRR